MATAAALRDALEVRLQTITGLRATDLAPSRPPATPSAWIRPQAVGQVTDDGEYDWVFTVEVVVSINSLRAAQDDMDTYLPNGENDVVAALTGDQTLGGIAGFVRADMVDGSYGPAEMVMFDRRFPYFGCQFRVEVG